jgi:hypothetical protein
MRRDPERWGCGFRLVAADPHRALDRQLSTRSGHLTVGLIAAIPVVLLGRRCGVKREHQCRLETGICWADLQSR